MVIEIELFVVEIDVVVVSSFVRNHCHQMSFFGIICFVSFRSPKKKMGSKLWDHLFCFVSL